MNTLTLPAIVAASFLAAAATGCKEKHTDTKVPVAATPTPASTNAVVPLRLASYEVPKNQGSQVQQILARVFSGVKDKVAARAALSPDGQLVVVAPEGIHGGVKKLIEKMAKRKPPQPASAEITYWLVVGRPAPKPSYATDLTRVKSALQAVTSSQGPMEFALLERLRLRTLADHHGRTRGTHADLRQTVSLVGGKVVGDLYISVNGPKGESKLETRVVLDPSKELVLGEAGYRPPADLWPLRTGTANKPSTLFYVIQTRIIK